MVCGIRRNCCLVPYFHIWSNIGRLMRKQRPSWIGLSFQTDFLCTSSFCHCFMKCKCTRYSSVCLSLRTNHLIFGSWTWAGNEVRELRFSFSFSFFSYFPFSSVIWLTYSVPLGMGCRTSLCLPSLSMHLRDHCRANGIGASGAVNLVIMSYISKILSMAV